MGTGFLFQARVYYEDTDAGGVVFYANYLRFMERARTEWLRQLGFEQDEVLATDGVVFAVSGLTMDFLVPARFNDLLDVSVAVTRLGKASISLDQKIHRQGQLLNSATVKLACVDKESFAPKRIPERIFRRIQPEARNNN